MIVNVCGVVSLQEIAARVEAAVTDKSKAGAPSFLPKLDLLGPGLC